MPDDAPIRGNETPEAQSEISDKPKVIPVRGFRGGDPVEIGKKGGRPKGRKTSDPLDKLDPRRRQYAINRANNMPKYQAALAAGFSPNIAKNAKARIETPDYQEAFKAVLRRKIPLEKAVKRIEEGMDAANTEFFSCNGKVTDSRDTVNWQERRKYTDLYLQASGAYVPRHQVDQMQRIDENQLRRMIDIAEKLNLAALPPERLRELEASHVPLIEAKIISDSEHE